MPTFRYGQLVHDISMDIECIRCKKVTSLSVNPDDYHRWQQGELIQNAMPYLSADEREILISGICGKCYDAIYETMETD